MTMRKGKPLTASAASTSRRQAVALMLGASPWLSAVMSAADAGPRLRLAISESMVTDVNLNDARAAILVWIKQMSIDLNLPVDVNPKVFDTTQEILERARSGRLDAVALNVVEYRQMTDVLDGSQVITGDEAAVGADRYVILVKQNSGIQKVGDLRGRRLIMLKSPFMCVAPAWLSTILDEGHSGPSEQFFGSLTTDPKVSRVVLPVFFGQAEACLTSQRGFNTMGELNPQVAKSLRVLASSPAMVVSFYVFRKGCANVLRDKMIKALSRLRASPSGQQLATLFQFEGLAVRDARCLEGALGVLDMEERSRSRRGAGSRE